MRPFLIALATAAFAARATAGTPDCASFDRLVDSTYGFKPSALDQAQQTLKSKGMDEFWASVRSRSSELLPCLRAALATRTNDPFFEFDGSMLLVSLDSSRAAKALQVAALDRVDLADVDPATVIRLAAQRALEGFDTSPVGANWLALPDSVAKYFVAPHSMWVHKMEGAIFLFGPLPESLATPALSRVAAIPKHPGRELAFWLLMQQAAPAARKALATLPRDGLSKDAQKGIAAYLNAPPPPKSAKHGSAPKRQRLLAALAALAAGDSKPFDDLEAQEHHLLRDAERDLLPEDMPTVRAARRARIAFQSDEALDYYTEFTELLQALLARAGGS